MHSPLDPRRGIREASRVARGPAPTKAFEWYLDGVKWLLAISAAAIAFGVACLEKGADAAVYWAFALYVPALMVNSAAGVWYLFWSYEYADARENGLSRRNVDVRLAKSRSNLSFNVVVWSFFLGMVLFGLFGGIYVWSSWNKQQGDSPELQALAPGVTDQAVLRRGDRAWILTRRPDGSLYWRPLHLAP